MSAENEHGPKGDMGKSPDSYANLSQSDENPGVIQGLSVDRDKDGVITGITRTGGVEAPTPQFIEPTPVEKPGFADDSLNHRVKRPTVIYPDGPPAPVEASSHGKLEAFVVTPEMRTPAPMPVEATPTTPESSPQPAPKYELGTKVRVIRSNNDVEDNWEIVNQNWKGEPAPEGKILAGLIVDGKITDTKPYYPEKLAAIQPVFEIGQTVKVDTTGSLELWKVEGHEENGKILVIRPTASTTEQTEIRRLSPVELAEMQTDAYADKKYPLPKAVDSSGSSSRFRNPFKRN